MTLHSTAWPMIIANGDLNFFWFSLAKPQSKPIGFPFLVHVWALLPVLLLDLGFYMIIDLIKAVAHVSYSLNS